MTCLWVCVQERNGGAGVYSADETKRYLLEDPNWRRDIIPEIMDGHNIMDFVDPDIEAKLEALERDEDERAAAFAASVSQLIMLVDLEITSLLGSVNCSQLLV